MAQQDDTAWTWSVEASDIQGHNKSTPPRLFYLPNDTVNISWDIKPASNTTINAAQMQVYPKDTDKSKIKRYSISSPYKGYTYVPLDENMYLIKSAAENQRIYNVEINANAETGSNNESKEVNETHIIEIKVMKPGSLEIQKKVPMADVDLSGWKFTLVDPTGTNLEKPEVEYTNSLGVAVFPELRPGNYIVEESPRSGWRQTNPTLVEVPVEVRAGERSTQEFFNIPNSLKITKVDSEGHPVSGWVFNVDGPEGIQRTKPTDASGVTIIRGLASGTYRISEEMDKGGWRQVSGPTSAINFASGEEKSVEFVNARTGTLNIAKKDSAGAPLSGWSFRIEGPDTKTTGPTDSSGTITITDLLPGEYAIHENLNSEWVNITPIQQRVVLPPGETATVQFVNDPLLNLEILKFNDVNGNGNRDVGADGSSEESGLSGWMFSVEGPDGFKTVAGPTNSEGMAIVRGVTPGSYVVAEEITSNSNPGWIATTPNPQQVKISRNSPNRVEFGNKVNTITITSFEDANFNGKRDKGEIGLQGWTMVVGSPNGSIKASNPTNAEGITTLKGMLPGRYNISENLKAGWINTTPLSISVPIVAGESKAIEFGNIKTGSIEIFKFNDTNRNGIIDSDEKGSSGWVFTIKGSNGFVVTTKPTDESGITALDGLLPGNYTVTESLLDGWLSTTSPSVSISLSVGDLQKLTFGNYYCLRCHRINDQPKIGINRGPEITVIKTVSDISVQTMDRENGNLVDYNITICPTRGLENIAAVPTDIVIALDNSPSILHLNKSAIDGVQKLAKDIAANDMQNVTRVGLVSWSDKENSRIEVPLINDYASIAAQTSKIRFAEGKHTDYQIGMETALNAFKSTGIVSGREKKIVIITDASDNGTLQLKNVEDARYRDYTIFAIIVGNKRNTNASRILDSLTKNHQGYTITMKDLSELEVALVKMATSGAMMKNVRLVEVLPSYLALLNSTARDDNGTVQINKDGPDWSTTTVSWNIGDLSGCWSTYFQAAFCWKLPADINQPRRVSLVNYTDEKGISRSLELPEHEINIVPSLKGESQEVPAKAAMMSLPGFEALFAVIWVTAAGCLYRRKN